MTAVVLLHFAAAAAASHADILEGAAEAGRLVAFEVRQRNEDVRIHHRAADQCGLTVLSVRHRHFDIIGSPQSVRDENLAAGRNRIEAVDIGAVQMLKRILAAARIKRVTVCQERNASVLLHDIRHGLRIIRPQIGEIAQLAEVHFDRHKLAVHVDLIDPGFPDQLLQLLRERYIQLRSEICKINL